MELCKRGASEKAVHAWIMQVISGKTLLDLYYKLCPKFRRPSRCFFYLEFSDATSAMLNASINPNPFVISPKWQTGPLGTKVLLNVEHKWMRLFLARKVIVSFTEIQLHSHSQQSRNHHVVQSEMRKWSYHGCPVMHCLYTSITGITYQK